MTGSRSVPSPPPPFFPCSIPRYKEVLTRILGEAQELEAGNAQLVEEIEGLQQQETRFPRGAVIDTPEASALLLFSTQTRMP